MYPRKIASISMIILCSSIFMGFYLYNKSKFEPPIATKVVETELTRPTKIQQLIKLIGTIHPKHTSILVAKGSGVLDVLIYSGETVKKGDLIAKIINPGIEKNYQLSKDALQITKNQYQRFLTLKNKGLVSILELEEKKQQWIEAQKNLAKSKMELTNMRFYSPFDGIVGAFKLREGAQVNEGSAVFTVYDPMAVTIDIDIPCHYLKSIKENQSVYVFNTLYHLSHLQKMMDDETHMCPADVDIKCDHCIIGDSLFVTLVIKEKDHVLVIPDKALFLKDGLLSVYKTKNHHIELVRVKQGIQEQDKVEISSGLKTGDEVIIKNPERLSPGLEVIVMNAKTQFPTKITT